MPIIAAAQSATDKLRIATWNIELSRKGPGLLLRDIAKGSDAQILAAIDHIHSVNPDVLLLTGFDTDPDGQTLHMFSEALAQHGQTYDHIFTRVGNAGLPTGLDLDKDGRLGEPQDAQSYGEFRGVEGMALLSRVPFDVEAITDFTSMLWKDVPAARIPEGFWNEEDLAVLRLSSNNHWSIPLQWGNAALNLFAFHAGTPVFDGDEDRNGRRNADEIALWLTYLEGRLGVPEPHGAFVILGDANLDPEDGDGLRNQMRDLLNDPRLQDPMPKSEHGRSIANEYHQGDPALDTADWSDPQPGNLRVDYVLPSADLRVLDAGVAWQHVQEGVQASRHGLVWVDIAQFP